MKTATLQNNPIGTARVVQVLCNQAQFSDLTLVVDETRFYCYQAVMVPISKYLERCVAWSQNHQSDCIDRVDSISTVNIDVPDIRSPDGIGPIGDHSKAYWFGVYFKVAHGLHSLSTEKLDEIFVVAQIAEFMMSPSVSAICDQLLRFLSFRIDSDQALNMALLCQTLSLSATVRSLLNLISPHIQQYMYNPKLYEIDPKSFSSIVKNASHTPNSLWIAAFYASRTVPKDGNWPPTFHIKEVEMVNWFQDVVCYIMQFWDPSVTDAQIKSLQRYKITFGPAECDHSFLYRAIAERYYEFRRLGCRE